MGVDANNADVLRLRGASPAYQLRNINYSVTNGGLFRVRANDGHLCFERNTHVSGTFATYSEDLEILQNGYVGIGDIVPQYPLDINGNTAIRGSLSLLSGTNYIELKTPDSLGGDRVYTLPNSLPSGTAIYLTGNPSGVLNWSASIGESNQAANTGSGEGVYSSKLGEILQFKSLVAGLNIGVSSSSDEITITGVGEANTASNLGAGFGLFTTKSSVDLPFKSLLEGTNITLNSSSTDITIGTTAEINSGSSLGSGTEVYSGKNGTILEFRSLVAGPSIQINSSSTEIFISSSAEINAASNLDGGEGIFAQKSGSILEFKGILVEGPLNITASSTNITISCSAENNTASNLGAGTGIWKDKSGTDLRFKSLKEGTNISISASETEIFISNTEGGEANLGANIGSGEGIFADKSGVTLNFRSLIAGSNIGLTSGSDTLTIDASASGEANTATNLGSGEGIFAYKSGVDLNFRSLLAGSNIGLTSGTNGITIDASSSGEANTGANVGSGVGIFKDKTSLSLNFKSLLSGGLISIVSSSTDITISSSAEANTASNLGAGTGIFANKSGVNLNFKSLLAGTNVTLSTSSTDITVATTAEINTAANTGSGYGIYANKVAPTLNFKGLLPGTNISLASSSTDITINTTAEINIGANLGAGAGIYASKSGSTLQFNSLVGGGGVSITTGSNTVIISDEIITASNLGTGFGIFSAKSGSILQFNSIAAPTNSVGESLNLSLVSNVVQITKKPLRKSYILHEDFSGATSDGTYTWLNTTSGANSLVAPSTVGFDVAPLQDAFGVIELRTGTSVSGRAAISSYANALRLDKFDNTTIEWRVYIQNLSTVTQEYRATFGWMSSFASGDQANGIYFEYDRLTAGDFWRCDMALNTARNKQTTSVAVQTGSYSTFRIYTSASVAYFYINDVQIASGTLDFPVGSGATCGFGAKIEKTAGALSRSMYIDYLEINANWAGTNGRT